MYNTKAEFMDSNIRLLRLFPILLQYIQIKGQYVKFDIM